MTWFCTSLNIGALKDYIRDTGLKIQINSQKAIVARILLVLFCSTIFQSCQPTNAGVVIHGMQLDATVFSTNVTTQYQNITYDEDLLVHNNQTFTIENSEFLMNGTITVEDTSTLIIRNSNFTTIPDPATTTGDASIILVDQSNLIIIKTTAIFIHPYGDFNCKIFVRDDAKANITHSTLQNLVYVRGSENSVIHVNNSTIVANAFWTKSGVATSDNSTAEIEKSIMEGAFIWDNSTASIKNSVVELLGTGSDPPDKTTINVVASKIDQLEAFGATKICVEDSTVTHMNAHSNAEILFVDCHVGRFETHGNPKVVVGWNLPLFGLVKMPHTWIPYVQVTIVVAIGATIFIVLRLLLRRRARIQEAERGREEKAQRIDPRQDNPPSHPRTSGFARNFSRQERTLNNSFAEKPALRSFARSQNMSALISRSRPHELYMNVCHPLAYARTLERLYTMLKTQFSLSRKQ
jgi:hypothetical protein